METEHLDELKTALREERPESWDRIPDIDLYMDQVIAYLKRQHIGFLPEVGDEQLTSSMINNYIKSGVMPRAHGKRYDREHIGYLTAIALLKQVFSVSETGDLLKELTESSGVAGFYDRYSRVVDEEYTRVADLLEGKKEPEELSELALRLAVSSYAERLAARMILKDLVKK
ncbi:MAG: DUF1836 domain-containing protein [Anaerovoracaceae bacterium]|jgi:hypothetical protein